MGKWKIEPRDEMEVYITERGDIAIKQCDPIGNPDHVVVIPRGELDRVIGFMRAAAQEIDAAPPGEYETDSEATG